MAWKILIVDDDQSFLDFLKEGLELHGHEVHTSKSGKEAARKLVERNFDFLISDYFMPGGDGRWLYKFIEKANPALANKIIFVTGDPGEKKVTDHLVSTNCVFLMKPLKLENLIRTMEWVEKTVLPTKKLPRRPE